MPRLLARREVWLPTPAGWALVAAAVVAGVALVLYGSVGFLQAQAPAAGPDGGGAPVLVVEGWLEEDDLDTAVAAVRRGRYQRVVTTGGPIESRADARRWGTYAARGAAYLAPLLAPVRVEAVAAPPVAADRTYASAMALRERMRRDGPTLRTFDVFTAGVHARRTRMVYRLAFGPSVEVGVLASATRGVDGRVWWHSSAGAKAVVGEWLALGWTVCCFWPPEPAPLDAATPVGTPAEHATDTGQSPGGAASVPSSGRP